MIDLTNYEAYLLRSVDGELNPREAAELKVFLERNPSLEAELKLLEATRLDPEDSLVFPDKAALYRHTVKDRRWGGFAPVGWAAAAAVVLLVGAYFLLLRERPGQVAEASGTYAYQRTPVLPPVVPATTLRKNGQTTQATQPTRTVGAPVPSPQSLAGDVHPAHAEAKALTGAPRPPVEQAPNKTVVVPLTPLTLSSAGAGSVAIEEMPATVKAPPASPGTGISAKTAIALPVSAPLASATEKLGNGKKQLDQTITQGLSEFQQKTANLLGHLEQRQIRIGRFTLALNP